MKDIPAIAMDIIGNDQPTPDALKGAALAIGNFDGVHKGHVAVLAAAAKQAGRLDCPFGAVVFEPHPREFFTPHIPLFRLTRLADKARLMDRLGLDVLHVVDFDDELAALSAADFVTRVLSRRIDARHIVAGYDFRFGKGREGDTEILARLCHRAGIGTTIVEPAIAQGDHSGEAYSSTAVRRTIEAGDPYAAALMLGHWWSILGIVENGDRRGRTIGYPTANIHLPEGQVPRLGIYAAAIRIGGEIDDPDAPARPGVAYFGTRPTFGKEKIVLEAHLFDFSGDLYGEELKVEFVDFIRGDEKFDNVDALVARMDADAAAAREILKRVEREQPIAPLTALERR